MASATTITSSMTARAVISAPATTRWWPPAPVLRKSGAQKSLARACCLWSPSHSPVAPAVRAGHAGVPPARPEAAPQSLRLRCRLVVPVPLPARSALFLALAICELTLRLTLRNNRLPSRRYPNHLACAAYEHRAKLGRQFRGAPASMPLRSMRTRNPSSAPQQPQNPACARVSVGPLRRFAGEPAPARLPYPRLHQLLTAIFSIPATTLQATKKTVRHVRHRRHLHCELLHRRGRCVKYLELRPSSTVFPNRRNQTPRPKRQSACSHLCLSPLFHPPLLSSPAFPGPAASPAASRLPATTPTPRGWPAHASWPVRRPISRPSPLARTRHTLLAGPRGASGRSGSIFAFGISPPLILLFTT